MFYYLHKIDIFIYWRANIHFCKQNSTMVSLQNSYKVRETINNFIAHNILIVLIVLQFCCLVTGHNFYRHNLSEDRIGNIGKPCVLWSSYLEYSTRNHTLQKVNWYIMVPNIQEKNKYYKTQNKEQSP